MTDPTATTRKNSRARLIEAAVGLIARRGLKAASVRAIASAAGLTEAAVYRHFASKEQLYVDAYTLLITDMIRAKEAIASRPQTLAEKVHEWVRVSYESFDEEPDAFTFVLLIPHDLPEAEREITTRQGRLFMDLVRQAQASGEMPPMPAELALSHFTGVMLNVPRLINEGTLGGPASQYVDAVTEAVRRVLNIEP
jgi:AcrR family transcriptional regulator